MQFSILMLFCYHLLVCYKPKNFEPPFLINSTGIAPRPAALPFVIFFITFCVAFLSIITGSHIVLICVVESPPSLLPFFTIILFPLFYL
jgi:hypothetical protein